MADSDNKINIGDDWKAISSVYINVGDAWKEIAEGYINIGDSWKQWWTTGSGTPSTDYYEYTVLSSYIDSNLTHFPVPVRLNSSHTAMFTALGANYKYMRVKDAIDGDELYVDVEYWDESGEEGLLWISRSDWVLSSTTDTKFYIYYDQTSDSSYIDATGTATAANVWNSGYLASHHLNSSSWLDATSNNNDGTDYGTTDVATAYLGNGFSGDYSDGINLGNLAISADAITVQGWFKWDGTGTDYVRFVAKQYDGVTTGDSCYQLGKTNTAVGSNFRWSVGSVFDHVAGTAMNSDTWYFLAGTYDKSHAKLFINDTKEWDSTSHSSAIRTSSQDDMIGVQKYNTNYSYGFYGLSDEVRISTVARSDAWLKADYYLQTGDALQKTVAWDYRMPIVIDADQVDTNLTSITIQIWFTSTNLKTTGNGGHVQNANGYDITFYASDGTTELNWDREFYDATTGELCAWVQIPSVSSSADTTIYVYYGSTEVVTARYGSSAYSSDYHGVWLFDTAGNDANDKTSNNFTATGHGTSTYKPDSGVSSDANRKSAYYADLFKGSSDPPERDEHFDLPSTFDDDFPSTDYTVMMWVHPDTATTTNAYDRMFGVINSTNIQIGYRIDTELFWYRANSTSMLTTSTYSTGSWYHLAFTHTSGGTKTLYINGSAVGDTSGGPSADATFNSIGAGNNENAYSFNGQMDSVMVIKSALSSDEIASIYNNQNDASSWMAVGSEESV